MMNARPHYNQQHIYSNIHQHKSKPSMVCLGSASSMHVNVLERYMWLS